MRLFLLFLGLAALVLIPFFIWGDDLMSAFSEAGAIAWLNQFGNWAWAVGILLLMGDLLLPLPATVIMAALGYTYGFLWGGLISAIGSFVAGSLGYWLCRMFGKKTALKLLGEKDFERGEKIFSRQVGGWLIVLSRWLPVFPEVLACMAGLARMPVGNFHTALAAGSIPLGFTYAYLGSTGVDHPVLAIVLSAGVPPVIWLLLRPAFQKRMKV